MRTDGRAVAVLAAALDAVVRAATAVLAVVLALVVRAPAARGRVAFTTLLTLLPVRASRTFVALGGQLAMPALQR